MTTLDLPGSHVIATPTDEATMAAYGFLARYRDPTRNSYAIALRQWFAWCDHNHVPVLEAKRAHIELYTRCLQEQQHLCEATVNLKLTALSMFYRVCVADEIIVRNPCEFIRRPKVDKGQQRRPWLNPLEFAALLDASRRLGPDEHALVALMGMLGLRVSEATGACIEHIRATSGYEVLDIIGKGNKAATLPMPIPVLRAVHEATAGRTSGPIVRNRDGVAMDRKAAARALNRCARAAGLDRAVPPHALRRTFATAGLMAGVSLRDIQVAMRHEDPRTTTVYDRDRRNLDRFAGASVASFLSGMTSSAA